MFELYLGSLIFGGGLLSLSLLFGGDSDSADVDVDSDVDIDGSVDAEVDLHVDVDADVHADLTPELNVVHTGDTHIVAGDASGGLSAVAEFFSVRNGLFFLAFFGLTGVIFDAMEYAALVTLSYALIAGTGSAFMGYKLMKYLKDTETGQTLHLAETRGRIGTVVVDISRDAKGKIRIHQAGNSTTILAAIHDTAARDVFHAGEEVVVVRVINNVAWIVESD